LRHRGSWNAGIRSANIMRLRTILIGSAIVAASFLGATVAMQVLSSGPGSAPKPALVEAPPLREVTRTSMIVTPTAIALTAIRDALDASAPRNVTGKRENPISQLLSNADIGWTVGRGPLAVAGRPEGLAVSTLLTGTLHVTGQIAAQVGNIGGALGGILNQKLGQRQCHHPVAPRHRGELADRAQSHRPGGGRGFLRVDCRHQDRGDERGEAVPGPPGQ
jgi:hypothetical protein